MLASVVLGISLAGLIIGSVTDLRTREVPDWINYGLIVSGFGCALIATIINWQIGYLLRSLLGFGFFLVIALLMYYTGQWGGGDSKMIMGIGALVGMSIPSFAGILFSTPFLVLFIVYSMVIGAVYGLAWSAALAIKNRKRFGVEFRALQRNRTVNLVKICLIALSSVAIAGSFLVSGFLKFLLLIVAFIVVITFYLFLFVKIVERTCMLKHIAPDKLTEGDWIAEEVKIDGKIIVSPKDLGINKAQILELSKLYKKGKVKDVLVKEGIPFVPSFLAGFLLCLWAGNVPLLLFLS
jgi:Flp pilus assembly protein protease CpaA